MNTCPTGYSGQRKDLNWIGEGWSSEGNCRRRKDELTKIHWDLSQKAKYTWHLWKRTWIHCIHFRLELSCTQLRFCWLDWQQSCWKLKETLQVCRSCPLSNPLSALRLPGFAFLKLFVLSQHKYHFFFFLKEFYISSQCFDEVPSFHFHCGCILCRPARLRQSIVALLYSGLKTRDGRGEGGGRKDDRRARAQSFRPGWWRLSAPLRYNSHRKPVGLAVQPCGSETFLVHTLKRPDFSQ